ncbi:Lrp/AsnC family transcriptional regulator [Planktomarina sp.]|jgi:DNA-binding Lrp family transcriptional regulator|nr:Lrp/AsnC family transcriptional regulator [Planktomarina sp.]MBL6845785.1 Lrp/AsnC family transcriptional regulator [Planktomarina sp.]MDA9100465.1 Lrp/AsnC family transcriptional regulator [Planktomarina sp.]MDB4051491.1 Lrp/AsnC family transcriptional regulator [Planktomarina sp.]MDC1248978.1 Lrp/AsnC family transcriptional regulator [Planktomarina sp.]MDS9950089.1 Lrp/AsnC family transcriptional regulator [Planktomarina sp.]|tara:strand:+ start:165 stop:641 length:477 start_codon:yes stop_codon:yes gene_type:complete
MDDTGLKLIKQLQVSADLSLAELSRRVGISKTACWNRMQKMEEEGIVLGKQVLFDRNSLGLKIVVFLSITVGRHSTDWVEKFTEVIEKFPEIVEVHRLTGEGADYQLKVVCPSIELYDLFQQNLISKIDFTSMSTKMSLKQLKDTSLLPLSHLETLSD